MILEFIIHSTIHATRKINGKIDVKTSIPPNYFREAWDYKNPNKEGNQKCISSFNWKKYLNNLSLIKKLTF